MKITLKNGGVYYAKEVTRDNEFLNIITVWHDVASVKCEDVKNIEIV